jgi:hypothetical protein
MDWKKFVTRKFVAATMTAGLMAVCWVAGQWLPGVREQLPALFTGLVGALSAFTAGNLAQDHFATKADVAVKTAQIQAKGHTGDE